MLDFRNRLRKMARHYDKWARRQGLEAYRIYDADLEEHPLTIDRYDDQLYVALYAPRRTEWSEDDWTDRKLAYLDAIAETLDHSRNAIFFKLRQRQSGTEQYEKLSIAKREFTVVENDLGFIVNLTDYLDTGLFLDHRNTRLMVAERSHEKYVLNLFSYTCSFGVYAAAGGAIRVDNVDLSSTYLDWGKRNFEINEIEPNKHRFLRADTLAWLAEPVTNTYDIIVLDPPTFSNSKAMRDVLDTQRDYPGLLERCCARLNPGGQLFFSTNYRKFKFEEAAVPEGFSVREITKQTLPQDFRRRNLHRCWLLQRPGTTVHPPAA